MTTARVAAVVLAAGLSARFGRPKQLLPLSGRPLLERTLDVARFSSLDPRVVVLGAHAESIRAAVNLRGFNVIENPQFATGQASSLRVGLASLPEDVDAAVVFLGDQPLVRPWHIRRIVEAFDPAIHVAVRPRYFNGPGNPVLLARTLFSELARVEGDLGARDVLRGHADRVAQVEILDTPPPPDVDTEDDYRRLLLDWSSLGAPDIPRYCQRCGAEVSVIERHARNRPVCPRCNFTYFTDPKIAVAVIVEIGGQIVLQRRAIEPGIGKWTFPGGFADRGEVLPEAAAREVAEEVGLRVSDLRLIGVYSEPGETVVLVAYAATANGQTPIAGDECSDVRLFSASNLPDLAFSRDAKVLDDWRRS